MTDTDIMEADEVTVVVHGARHLQGKKPGRCKFSVIFGVGNKKFRTSVIKEPTGNPDWNEESSIPVQHQSDHVFFTVTEKDDVMGQVQLPVSSLTCTKGKVRQTALKAHRKCPVPQGELIFQAFVSKQRPQSSEAVNPQIRSGGTGNPAQLTGFARLRHSLAISPALPRKSGPKRDSKDSGSVGGEEKADKKRGSTLSFFNKKLSKSLHDIFHIGRGGGNDDDDGEGKSNRSSKGKFGSVSDGLDFSGRGLTNHNDDDIPVVTNIIPNMATVHGDTRLCVEGRNLGLGKSDIMEFMLCGVDLLDTIDFESDSRIYVTTKPNTPGKGDLWIETVSGGQNVIKSVFTFVDRTAEKNGTMERQAPPPSPSAIPPSPKRDAPLKKPASPVAPPRVKSMYIEEESLGVGQKHITSVHRSASQGALSSSVVNSDEKESGSLKSRIKEKSKMIYRKKQQKPEKGSDKPAAAVSTLSGASTLPRVKSTTDLDPEEQPEIPGRFRKNHQTHTRRASESIVAMQRGGDIRSSASEKAELQKEIVRLMKENEALHKKNDDLNAYIQDLVAKVMENCPEVLAAMPSK